MINQLLPFVSDLTPENTVSTEIHAADASLVLHDNIWPEAVRLQMFAELHRETPWKQCHLSIHGQAIPRPRLEAWFGEPGCVYTYSGTTFSPHPMTGLLLEIRRLVERLSGATYNSVLLNLYRNEYDSVSPHADDEPGLGEEPVIASVSFGATRLFKMQHTRMKTEKIRLWLYDGQVLVMAGPTQKHWLHSIPKGKSPVGPRINLTWRYIRPTR